MKRPTAHDAMAAYEYASMAAVQQSAKRHRSNNYQPSKCIHVRSLPPYTSEQELAILFSPFGRVEKMLIMTTKFQAFVQMDSMMAAASAVNHYAIVPALVRNRPVFVQFSTHQELKSQSSGGQHASMPHKGPPLNSILMVNIESLLAPITLENLYAVFKPFGTVLKIVTFMKTGNHKALVQMSSKEAAVKARNGLEGKDMFEGCCTLHLNFSRLSQLDVQENSCKSWDFTQKSTLDPHLEPAFNMTHVAKAHEQMQMAARAAHAQMYGYTMNPYDANVRGGMFGINPGRYDQSGYGLMFNSMSAVSGHHQGHKSLESSVVLVSNLPADGSIKPSHLFNLFGCYGNVVRVKILLKKTSTALIQFRSPTGANLAKSNLHGLALGGATLDVRISKHSSVSLPKEDNPESAPLNADYSNSGFHRFKVHETKNALNIFRPSPVLHVSNLPMEVKEIDLMKMFSSYNVVGFSWLEKVEKKMAYVQLVSVQNAVMALMNLHNSSFLGRPIKLSFTKKDPSTISKVDKSLEMKIETTSIREEKKI